MKRLLSVVAMLAVSVTLLPATGHAGLRGAFDPISRAEDFLIRGKFSPTYRKIPASGSGTAASPRVERWLSFVTLSSIVGSESVGEIWLYRNTSSAVLAGLDPQPMLRDPTAAVSYIDPEWSKDGKWLAYVQTDNAVTSASIYVQQYDNSTATLGNVALGSPILVADGTGGIHHRHPVFNSTATRIYYDSDAFGPSIDLWSVDISLDATAHTGTVGTPVRHQLGLESNLPALNGKAEFKPAVSPDDSKVAYVTNRFGTFQIQILTVTASGLGEVSVGAEANPALVTHDNPSWAPNGTDLYYDAPSSEDPANPQDIWRLNLTTGAKCNIFIDLAGDTDPNVSQYTNTTPDGATFNFFLFISQAGGLGVQIWRGEAIQNCKAPLPMAVVVTPSQVDISKGFGGPADSTRHADDIIAVNLSFPAATRAAGYVCRAANVGGDAIRMRRSIIASPTMLGLADRSTPTEGDCTNMDMLALFGDSISCFDEVYYFLGNIGNYDVVLDPVGNDHHMNVYFPLRNVRARIVALGLVNQYVGLPIRAYSNRIGQQFIGFGYIKLSKKNLAGSSIALQQNYPNPFNPVTKINFAVDKPGNVSVRVFNTRGELVKTITNQWYPQGQHSVSWDGKTQTGGKAASGIYYMQAKSNGSTDVIKTVLEK